MTSRDTTATVTPSRLTRAVGWFLALTYGAGASLTAVLEVRDHIFSQRFGYPSAFMLAVFGLQIVCAAAILIPRLAVWAAIALSVTTLGAIASHIRIGSPQTAWAAVLFTVLQVWYAVTCWRKK